VGPLQRGRDATAELRSRWLVGRGELGCQRMRAICSAQRCSRFPSTFGRNVALYRTVATTKTSMAMVMVSLPASYVIPTLYDSSSGGMFWLSLKFWTSFDQFHPGRYWPSLMFLSYASVSRLWSLSPYRFHGARNPGR
jgi:hypothetical protein